MKSDIEFEYCRGKKESHDRFRANLPNSLAQKAFPWRRAYEDKLILSQYNSYRNPLHENRDAAHYLKTSAVYRKLDLTIPLIDLVYKEMYGQGLQDESNKYCPDPFRDSPL